MLQPDTRCEPKRGTVIDGGRRRGRTRPAWLGARDRAGGRWIIAVNERLLRLLVASRIEYEILPHREAFTAQQVAQTSHVGGRQMAKVVVVRSAGGRHLMAVLPASCQLDLGVLERLGEVKGLTLANERELQRLFPDCEVGAMPPFGHLYDLPLYVDACLMEGESIVLQAGTHHEVVRMRVSDYRRLAGPFAAIECLHASLAAA